MKANVYKNYLLVVLLVILAFNYVDRLALGIVLQNIKHDLHLSDTQLGFLSGIAFTLFYAVMGIPIARWADRGNRIAIITLTTALWSVAVALCGAATSFLQLLLIRVGVGVGEAGCIPPAHSLIADYFTRGERPRATAIYSMGGSLSLVIGYFVAGWINELYGWRMVFLVFGLPGLALAALAWFTLREPRQLDSKAQRTTSATAQPGQPSLKEVWVTLWGTRTFRHILFSFSVLLFFSYGLLQWQPAFFERSHGLKSGEIGMWFALSYGLCGLVGTWLGGEFASRFAAQNERLQLRAMALICVVYGGFMACIYLAPNYQLAFAALALATIIGCTVTGPLFATIQTLVPPRMRAMSIALVYLFANLIGMGLGPLATGTLSDILHPYVGEESLRYALLALCPGFLWGAWHLWAASRTVTRDLEAVEVDRGGAGEANIPVSANA